MKLYKNLVWVLVLVPGLLFANVDEYQAEKSLYQANQLNRKLLKEQAQPRQSDFQEVIQAYQKVINGYPQWAQKDAVLLIVGDIYLKNNNYELARETFLTIIRGGYQKMMNNQAFNASLCAQARFKIALTYEKQGNWEEAEKNLEKIIADYPETLFALQAPIYQAEHYYQAHDEAAAEIIYQKALAQYLEIIDKYPQSQLAFMAKSLMEKSYSKVKEWEEMAQVLRNAIETNQDATAAFVELAKIYQKQNKFDEAVETFQKIIARRPDFYEARLELGKLYLNIGSYDLALEQADIVSAAQEYNLGALILRGYVNFYRRAYNVALSSFQRAINLGNRMPEIYNMIGIIQLKFEQYEAAREALETSLKLQPNSAFTHVSLGNLYLAEKKYDLAEKEYNLALGADKNFLEAYANLANLKINQQNYQTALEMYNKMLSINPQLDIVQYHIGEVYEFSGEQAKAIEYYKQTIAKLPKFTEPYNNLAYIYASQDQNLEEALKLIQTAADLEKDNSSILDTQGFVFYKLKRYDEALSSLEQARQLDSKHPYILFHLGLLKTEMQRPAEAKELLRQALANGLRGELGEQAKRLLKQ